MRKETTPTFEQTKEISYLSKLFDMVEAGRNRVRALEKAKQETRTNESYIFNEIESTHKKLLDMSMSNYMINKHLDKKHKYKFIHFLRKHGKPNI